MPIDDFPPVGGIFSVCYNSCVRPYCWACAYFEKMEGRIVPPCAGCTVEGGSCRYIARRGLQAYSPCGRCHKRTGLFGGPTDHSSLIIQYDTLTDNDGRSQTNASAAVLSSGKMAGSSGNRYIATTTLRRVTRPRADDELSVYLARHRQPRQKCIAEDGGQLVTASGGHCRQWDGPRA